jgi:hypothetical protein
VPITLPSSLIVLDWAVQIIFVRSRNQGAPHYAVSSIPLLPNLYPANVENWVSS